MIFFNKLFGAFPKIDLYHLCCMLMVQPNENDTAPFYEKMERYIM